MVNDSKTIVVEPVYLVNLLERALEKPIQNLNEPQIESIKGGLELDSSIYRLTGTVEVGGEALNWSLILKVVKPEAVSNDPQGYRYWKREALAYQSTRLQDLPGRDRADNFPQHSAH